MWLLSEVLCVAVLHGTLCHILILSRCALQSRLCEGIIWGVLSVSVYLDLLHLLRISFTPHLLRLQFMVGNLIALTDGLDCRSYLGEGRKDEIHD